LGTECVDLLVISDTLGFTHQANLLGFGATSLQNVVSFTLTF